MIPVKIRKMTAPETKRATPSFLSFFLNNRNRPKKDTKIDTFSFTKTAKIRKRTKGKCFFSDRNKRTIRKIMVER